MDAGSGGRGRAVSEINVTPMIDVLLVLLIIFMMIQPPRQSGLSAAIPQPGKPGTDTPSTVALEVLAGGDGQPLYRINQKSLARERIVPELAAIFAQRSDRTLFVKGDGELAYGALADAIDMAHQAGAETVGLMMPGDGVGQGD